MPLRPLTLLVPADPALRQIAGEVASRYFELSGGTAPAAKTFAGGVQRAVDAVPGGHPTDISLAADVAGVEASVSGHGQTTRVRAEF